MTSPDGGPVCGPGREQAREQGHGQGYGPDWDRTPGEPEEHDPGLARARTSMAWTRTALSFAALGGVVVKVNLVSGLIVLAIAPVIWQLGRVTRGAAPETSLPAVGATRLFAIAFSIAAVALLCLVVAILGHSAFGALR